MTKITENHRTRQQFGKNNHNWVEVDEKIVCTMYVNKGYSIKHIAKYFNTSRDVIRRRLKNNNIKLRSFSEQYKLDQSMGRQYNYGINKANKNGQYVHGRLVGQKENRKKYLNIVKAQKDWVCENCDKNNTKMDLAVHHKDRNNKNNKIENLMILCQSCHVKEHFKDGSMKGREKIDINENEIIKEYCVNGRSLVDLGKIYNVSFTTIRNRLLSYNIHIRSYSEQYQLDKENGRK